MHVFNPPKPITPPKPILGRSLFLVPITHLQASRYTHAGRCCRLIVVLIFVRRPLNTNSFLLNKQFLVRESSGILFRND